MGDVGGAGKREHEIVAISTPPAAGSAPAVAKRPGPDPNAAREQLRKELGRQEGGFKWLRRLIILLVIAGGIAGFVAYRIKHAPPPPPKYVLTEVTSGDVIESVQSTGQVKPVTEVQIGAQVSGRVTNVLVDFNSVVKRGGVLAEIDPTLISAQIESTSAQLASSGASVKRAEANLEAARIRLDRAKKLVKENVGNQAEVDTAQGAYDVAVADLSAARASVSQTNAQLKQSKTNLEYTKIISPIDGVVISRSIDPGQTVQASFQAPTLFVLAQDLSKMRVYADIDEADVGRVVDGLAAEINVDAFPSVSFKGKVVQVRLAPVTQQGVVTYAAIIDVDNPDSKLRPGMTATVTITSGEAKGVKRIPNAALRFRPSPPLDEAGKPIPQDPLPKLGPGQGRVWVLTDETPGKEKIEPRIVEIGISDGVNTVLKTDLGDAKIIRDETDAGADKQKRKGGF
ncbi:MAG: efflux RND transporter periplasmic adaptor subunit [Polyangiaceae bacterium]|nr:efflux RND transporter periplasmic adaptor subunit [Polyangiaceae bacterium]